MPPTRERSVKVGWQGEVPGGLRRVEIAMNVPLPGFRLTFLPFSIPLTEEGHTRVLKVSSSEIFEILL